MTAPFEAGVYGDMPETEYHADPVPGGSLSASGAKQLLICPARFYHDQATPTAPTAAMEFGTAVHKLVLRVGTDVVLVDADNYRTKAAQDKAKDARAAGKIPLLPADYDRARAVASAVLSHPVAGALFDPEHGLPERSLFWTDAEYPVWRRARLDWLPYPGRYQHRMIIPDLKTGQSASPAGIAKAVASLGYHIQAAWYLDAVRALGLDDDPAFVFVFVEPAPPYLVTVAQLDDDAEQAGRHLGRLALERYRDCTESGLWPGYTNDEIALISLPPWARNREETYL